MKVHPHISILRHTHTGSWYGGLFSLALVLNSTLGLAQTCSPTPSAPPEQCPPFNYGPCPTPAAPEDVDANNPNPDPPLEPIPTPFQPPDGSILTWRKYIPQGTGPFPTVLVIHGGGFHNGNSTDAGVEKVSRDLQSSGYLALAVTHRMAQCGRITGQDPNYLDPLSGRPPQQTDDIKSLIKAARSLTICNHNVGVVGGSSGGSHAVFVALDKTASPANTYPNWCQNGDDDRPLCAVGLSGGYDLSDRLPTGYESLEQTIHDVQNYTNSCVLADQKNVSPVAKVQPESQQTFKPIYIVNSDGDPMPWHQIEDMRCALVSAGINSNLYTVKTIANNTDHAFALWSDRIFSGGPKVRDQVLAFLDDHVKNPP